MALGNGEFQINDIVLNIPPESISIDRQSLNESWQTLRTRGSINIKAGYSAINITLNCKFTDTGVGGRNGYDQLRDLVSQFRVTPFCYVENSFLRNAIISGQPFENMMLALQQIEIRTIPETTTTLAVTMRFAWFNYKPYLKDFRFRKNIMQDDWCDDPRESNAWKLLYRAEQLKHTYLNPPASIENTSHFTFKYQQFELLSLVTFAQRQSEYKALQNFQRILANKSDEEASQNMGPILQKELETQLGDPNLAKSSLEEMFPGTSMLSGKDIAEVISVELNPATTTRYAGIVERSGWEVLLGADNKTFSVMDSPTVKLKEAEKKKKSSVLLTRQLTLNTDQENLIPIQVSISFENVLATLPVVGFTYPTYQHMGSIDAIVNITFMTTSEQGMKRLVHVFGTLEDQASRFRIIPQGRRNLVISNPLLNILGLHDFISDNIHVSTVPSQPGTYEISLQLVENTLDPKTTEKLMAVGYKSSDTDLVRETIKILSKYLVLKDELKDTKTSFKDLSLYSSSAFEIKGTSIHGGTFSSTGRTAGIFTLVKTFEEYLTKPLLKIAREPVHLTIDPSRMVYSAEEVVFGITALRYMTDKDIVGIEFMTENLLQIWKKVSTDPFQSRPPVDGELNLSQQANYSFLNGDRRLPDNIEKEVVNSRLGREATSPLEIGDIAAEKIRTIKSATVLKDWEFLITNWIKDKILNTDLIDLEEFALIKKMKESGIGEIGLGAYPDFPLKEVVSLMEADTKNPSSFLILKDFEEQFKKTSTLLSSKGLDKSVLLNPDFYVHGGIQDSLGGVVDQNLINNAMTAIKTSNQDPRMKVEKSFMQEFMDEKNQVDGIGVAIRKNLNYSTKILHQSFFSKFFSDTKEGHKNSEGKISFGKESLSSNVTSRKDIKKTMSEVVRDVEAEIARQMAESSNLLHPIDFDNQIISQSLQNGPILLKEINSLTDETGKGKGRYILNKREAATLKPVANDPKSGIIPIQHTVGISVLDSIGDLGLWADETEKEREITKQEILASKNEPDFRWPLASKSVPNITSRFGPRVPPKDKSTGEEGSRFHPGIDIGIPEGTTIVTSARGIIQKINSPKDNKHGKGFGISIIEVHHEGGYVTKYMHLQWEFYIKALQKTIEEEGPLVVPAGFKLGLSGGKPGTEGAGITSGPHLHFEILSPSDNSYEDGTVPFVTKAIDPTTKISESHQKFVIPTLEENITDATSVLSKSIEQLEAEIRNGQGNSLMRAYPAFKLYFIESDMDERRHYGFDDLFGYNAVREIQIVRNKQIATDLLVVQLSNVSGTLSNRKFRENDEHWSPKDESASKIKEPIEPGAQTKRDTAFENPIASLLLQTGVQVQMRLGYNNNPELLETVFNGTIMEIEFSERDDVVTIICQSYGSELIQSIFDEEKKSGGWFSNGSATGELINEVLASPEVKHFGRWETTSASNPDVNSLNAARIALTNRWKVLENPVDDNIFAPTTDTGLAAYFSYTHAYNFYGATLWDVLQEMTYRHPGFIAAPVPYQGKFGPRMTLYFGLPDQLYFSRDPTGKEELAINVMKEVVTRATARIGQRAEQLKDKVAGETLNEVLSKTSSDVEEGITAQNITGNLVKKLGIARGFIRPFRSYHILTSSMHIIHNSITNNGGSSFNAATVTYEDAWFFDPDSNEQTGQMEFSDPETFTLRADAGVPDEDVREMYVSFPNCRGEYMAQRYALSLLKQSLGKGYKGSIVIIGNPSIKPHDICFIADNVSDIYGPIEVEQVVHRMSQKHGFVTEIVPNMVLHVNELSTLHSLDGMGFIAQGLTARGEMATDRGAGKSSDPSDASSGFEFYGGHALGILTSTAHSMTLITSPFILNQDRATLSKDLPGKDTTISDLAFAFIYSKLLSSSQFAHPFRSSPLTHHGNPMLGGFTNLKSKTGSLYRDMQGWFVNKGRDAKLYWDDLSDRWTVNDWATRMNTANFWNWYNGDTKEINRLK